jgi:hypothetical protein
VDKDQEQPEGFSPFPEPPPPPPIPEVLREPPPRPSGPPPKPGLSAAATGYAAALTFIGTVLGFAGLGWVADWLLSTGPWGVIVGLVIGLIGGTHRLIREVNR